MCLRQQVHLGLGQRVTTESQLPIKPQQLVPAEEGMDVGRRQLGSAHDRPRRQVTHEFLRPVHVDARGREPCRAANEKALHVLVGQR